jgi:tRNA (cytidine32/uridine32-2'-O)-methyltransferase
LYAHFERALTRLRFLDPDNPRQLMRRLRRLFNRSQLDRMEVNILRGILSAAEKGGKGRASD